jgi:hypothetical protein
VTLSPYCFQFVNTFQPIVRTPVLAALPRVPTTLPYAPTALPCAPEDQALLAVSTTTNYDLKEKGSIVVTSKLMEIIAAKDSLNQLSSTVNGVEKERRIKNPWPS